MSLKGLAGSLGTSFGAALDNAMLYKDTTQWLRARSFGGLFLGLLLIANGACVTVAMLNLTDGRGGTIVFGVLTAALGLFTLLIGLTGHALTAREFHNRTFELYEVAGMSLEHMVLGKFVSMMVQFLFGFFCIVPFLFFAYLLGGLDFYAILATALTFAVIVPPVYLLALGSGLYAGRSKTLAGLVRVASVFGMVMLVPLALQILFVMFRFGGFGGGNPLVDFIKELATFDGKAWGAVAFWGYFYVLTSLLLFYVCCDAISPATDSRELQIKALSTLLCASLFACQILTHLTLPGSGGVAFLSMFIFIGAVLLGLVYFYTPVDVPVMVRNRRARARALPLRVLYCLFEPGPRGTVRTLLLICMMGLATLMVFQYAEQGVLLKHTAGAASYGLPSSGSFFMDLKSEEWLMLTLPVMVPFFVAFPGGLLVRLRALRENLMHLRVTVLLFWAIVGAGLVTALGFKTNFQYPKVPSDHVLAFLAVILTPPSSLAMINGERLIDVGMQMLVRVACGLLGILMLWRINAWRRKQAERTRDQLSREHIAAATAGISAGASGVAPAAGPAGPPPPLPVQAPEGLTAEGLDDPEPPAGESAETVKD